ncbi:MAG: RsmE family RNA methyltransferase [Puniceicoccaceae bacterium]
MNLLLVDEVRDEYRFSAVDPSFAALRRLGGGEVCVGVVNGPRGIGRRVGTSAAEVRVEDLRWETRPPPPPSPIDLVVGLPRPADARRILVQAGALGVRAITFVVLDRTPPGYESSRMIAAESAGICLREGLEQGFHTFLPSFGGVRGLAPALEQADPSRPLTVLDPYLGEALFGEAGEPPDAPGTIILGSERGFSPEEQKRLAAPTLRRRHLGPAILRTETAVTAAVTLAHRVSGYSKSCRGAVIRPG